MGGKIGDAANQRERGRGLGGVPRMSGEWRRMADRKENYDGTSRPILAGSEIGRWRGRANLDDSRRLDGERGVSRGGRSFGGTGRGACGSSERGLGKLGVVGLGEWEIESSTGGVAEEFGRFSFQKSGKQGG